MHHYELAIANNRITFGPASNNKKNSNVSILVAVERAKKSSVPDNSRNLQDFFSLHFEQSEQSFLRSLLFYILNFFVIRTNMTNLEWET